MRLAAIVGTNADFSYNRWLLQYMRKHFAGLATIDVLEIDQLPAFNEDEIDAPNTAVWTFKKTVQHADGLIFATPEYDHSIPAVLKSAIEWLSSDHSVLHHKPVMVVGVAYGSQASSRAQEHLRQILASPDCDAYTLPANEMLIGNAANVFVKGDLKDQRMQRQLAQNFKHFLQYIDVIQQGTAQQKGRLAMSLKEPFLENAYVSFPTGRMHFKEIQQIFSTLPFEIDLIDAHDRFSWFSDKPDRMHPRAIDDLGEPVWDCHPPKARPFVRQIIASFKDGSQDVVSRPMTIDGKHVLIQYYALRDVDGTYLGTIEFTGNVDYILELFRQGDFESGHNRQPDATSGASAQAASHTVVDGTPNVDAQSSASQTTTELDGQTSATPADDTSSPSMHVDADTSASQHDDSATSASIHDEAQPARDDDGVDPW